MKRKFALLLSVLMIVTAVAPATSVVLAANSAPTVLPAIRDWNGGSGSFTPDSSTVLVYNGTEAAEQIQLVQGFFADMLGLDLEIVTTAPSSNYIEFTIGSNQTSNSEGYTLVASATKIEITATTKIGLLYGGTSVVQSIYADGYFPCGTAVDWPEYKVRSGLIDVARTYMPISDLMDVTRYMAWYKLNEIHVHINDNGKNGYNAFRLESDIPGLQAEDGYYTKEEYRQYQIDAAKYGVTVITEIDSPHHARCFAEVNIDGWSPKLLTSAADGVDAGADGRALDIRDERTVQFILDLFEEYLGGDNPVIVNKVIHVGMDEYPKLDKFAEAAQEYINKLVSHVNSFGYKARFWSSYGSKGYLDGATIDKTLSYDVIYWDTTHSDRYQTTALLNEDSGLINYLNGYLYLVPGWNTEPWESFEDVFATSTMETLWNKWQVSQWTIHTTQATAEYPHGQNLLALDDERMYGASFSIWNDFGSAWFGITSRDVMDRLRNIVCFMAEKCWNGRDTASTITFANFNSRLEKLGMRGGDVDIFHRDLPDGGINIDFENNTVPSYVTKNGDIANGEFVLDGTSYISLPDYEYVGMPNTLSFDITLDEYPSERAYIFRGTERTYHGETKKPRFSIYIDPDGTVGFESLITESDDEYGYYSFSFDGFTLPLGKKTNVKLTCNQPAGNAANKTMLIVNDSIAFDCVSSLADKVTSEFVVYGTYSTLDIPLAKVGLGVKGKLDNIIVNGETSEIPDGENVALGKTYITYNLVDGVVTDENVISRLYSASLTDGEYDTNAPSSNQTNPLTGVANCNDGKWFGFFDNEGVPLEENCESGIGYVVIDLGGRYDISKIKMHVEKNNAPASVKAYVSDDGENYKSVGTLSGTAAGAAYWISAQVAASGRYIKLEVDLASYWALFNEIEVNGVVSDGADQETVEHAAVGKVATDLSGKAPLDSGNGVFNFGDVLTDGVAQNAFDATDSTWFGIQTWYNCTNGVASVVVDLGEEISIDKIKLHLANSDSAFTLDGKTDTINAPAPEKVQIAISSDGENYEKVYDVATQSDANIVYWTENAIGETARYVKVSITVKTSGVYYALIDEIAVYEPEEVVEPDVPVIDDIFETVEHAAVDKTATDLSGKAPLDSSNGVFNFGDVLTDGVAQNAFDATDSTWFGIQTWYNCTNGVASVVVDLGEEISIDKIKLHLANSDSAFTLDGKTDTINAPAPEKVQIAISSDGENYEKVYDVATQSDANIVYWTENAIGETARYVKVSVTVKTSGVFYALIDEIAVYETEETVLPEYLLGDVNSDGKLSGVDYLLLKRIVMGELDTADLKNPETADLRCDLTGDGNIKAADYFMLKRLILQGE